MKFKISPPFKAVLATLLVVIGFAVSSEAATDLMLANIPGLSVPVLTSINQNETPEQALNRYKKGITQTELSELWIKSSGNTPTLSVSNGAPSFIDKKDYVLIVANKPSDLAAGSTRVENVARLWREQGYEPILLALGAGATLNSQQQNQFHQKIADNFSALMSLGGDDIDPKLYREQKTFARYTHALRDVLEFKLVKTFKDRARGLFVGICRGHQMGAIVDGHTLYQDLVQDKVAKDSHHEASKHFLVMDPEMQRLTGIRRSSVTVNSIHHQAVRVNPLAKSRPVAISDDGIVEALEMKNGKGLSYQFHPELMAAIENTSLLDRYLGNKFFKAIGKKMREVRTSQPLCRRTHLF